MSNYSVKKIIRNTDTYCVSGGGGVVANPYGDGSDGDLTVTGTCYLEAKEYNFANLNICGGYLRFYGDGAPVIRVCGTTNLCNGGFCLNPECKCSEWLKNGTEGNYYARLGGNTNTAPTGCIPAKLQTEDVCRGGWGNGRGGDQSSAGSANTFNGTTRCAGGAASGVNGGGGGGYSTVGSAATSSAGGAGGSSTFSNISFDATCSWCCQPGSGGGGYGSTTGGKGGDMSLTNISTVNCWGDWPEAGYGGCSACCGGAGGNLTIAGLTNVSFCAGRGGNGIRCGGDGGCVTVNAGTINSYSTTTQCTCDRFVRAGKGGDADNYAGKGGSVCICGNLILCGTSLIGGDGGNSYCGTGGSGGCVMNRSTAQVCACNYVGPSTYSTYLRLKGGNGGCGRCGGSGGDVQIRCCNSYVEFPIEGGRGGDGVIKGGNGGYAHIGSGVCAIRSTLTSEQGTYDIKGGDGGNAIGGMYNLILATNVLCVCCSNIQGSGGCGGDGGDASSCATNCLYGKAGNGGNGGNAGNMSIIYGTCFGTGCINSSLKGGQGGYQGKIDGNIYGPAAKDGDKGKDGCLKIMQFKM